MAKKHRLAAAQPPQAVVRLQQMPGTKVLFWVLDVCPFCEARHYHPAGKTDDEPTLRLGEVDSLCKNGPYILTQPPQPKRKKGKRDRRPERWDEWLRGEPDDE